MVNSLKQQITATMKQQQNDINPEYREHKGRQYEKRFSRNPYLTSYSYKGNSYQQFKFINFNGEIFCALYDRNNGIINNCRFFFMEHSDSTANLSKTEVQGEKKENMRKERLESM